MSKKEKESEINKALRKRLKEKMKREDFLIQAYKMNTLELARQHKETCQDEECNVSLLLLMEMAKKSGVRFSDDEIEEFI